METAATGIPFAFEVNCPLCGPYVTTRYATGRLDSLDAASRALLSGWVREQKLNGEDADLCHAEEAEQLMSKGFVSIDEVLERRVPKTVNDTLNRSLRNLAKLSERPGHAVALGRGLRSACFAQTTDHMETWVEGLQEAGLVTFSKNGSRFVRLTAKGWQRVEELERTPTDSRQVFVAMSFRENLLPVYEKGIGPGIEAAGYEPRRVDRSEHNDKICDKIVAEIRRSRFLVADVTNQSQGVYFEAGFAMGLGLPVIWTCRDGDLEQCHFDTRQYNHIAWSDAADLRRRLEIRIRATIP